MIITLRIRPGRCQARRRLWGRSHKAGGRAAAAASTREPFIPLNAITLASRTLSDGAVLLNGAGAYYYLVGDMMRLRGPPS